MNFPIKNRATVSLAQLTSSVRTAPRRRTRAITCAAGAAFLASTGPLAGCGTTERSAGSTKPSKTAPAGPNTPASAPAGALATARRFVTDVAQSAHRPEQAAAACSLLTLDAQRAAVASLEGGAVDCPAAIANGASTAASSEFTDPLPPVIRSSNGTEIRGPQAAGYDAAIDQLQTNSTLAGDTAVIVFRGASGGISLRRTGKDAWLVDSPGALDLAPQSEPLAFAARAFRKCFARQTTVKSVPDSVTDTEDGADAAEIDSDGGLLAAGAHDVLGFNTPLDASHAFDSYVVAGQDSPLAARAVVAQVRASFRPDNADYDESEAKQLDQDVAAYGNYVVRVTSVAEKPSGHPLAGPAGEVFEQCGVAAERAAEATHPQLLPGGEDGGAQQDQGESTGAAQDQGEGG